MVPQLGSHGVMSVLNGLTELISSKACGALNGPKKPRDGLIDLGTIDGRPLIQSRRLCRMVVTLSALSIVFSESVHIIRKSVSIPTRSATYGKFDWIKQLFRISTTVAVVKTDS